MKKILISLLAVGMLVGCSTPASSTKTSSTSVTQKETKLTITSDVELVSVKTNLDGYKWVGSEIGDFKETSLKETIRLFSEKGTGIVY